MIKDRTLHASLHDLAQLTFQSDQSFGTLARRMIDRGLIECVPGPGRAARHRLTDQGQELRRADDDVVNRVVIAFFAPLTPGHFQPSTTDSANSSQRPIQTSTTPPNHREPRRPR